MFRAVAQRRVAGLVVRSCVLCTAFFFVRDAYEIYTTPDLTRMKPSQIWRPNLTEMPGPGSSQIWASQIWAKYDSIRGIFPVIIIFGPNMILTGIQI